MKNITYKIAFVAGLSVLTTLGLSQPAMAQRSNGNHGDRGGGGTRTFAQAPAARTFSPFQAVTRPTPVARQQMTRPAPQPMHVEQRQPAQPPAQPSIHNLAFNGAGRNNNGYNGNNGRRDPAWNQTPSRPVIGGNVHVGVNTHVNVRENNYHGGNRDFHPYVSHPYRPYNWGPRWHPIGFFINALTANAIRLEIANQWYYYDNGCYYASSGGGYSVVPPPVGAIVSYLPDGYESTMVGNDVYYYFAGAFYAPVEQGYEVVQAPLGAVITQLPAGAEDQQINGEDILVYNNVYYQPVSINGQDAYQVIQVY